MHCNQYSINNDLCLSRVTLKNTQIKNFLAENSDVFDDIYRIVIATKPKGFNNIYDTESSDAIIIITKIIVCAFLNGSHNVMDKERNNTYINMYLVLTDVIHTIVTNISLFFLTINKKAAYDEKNTSKGVFKIIEVGTSLKIFEDKIIGKKKKSIKLKRIVSVYKHFVMHLNIEYYEKPYTKIMISKIPYLTTCYYLDKIPIIRNNERSNDRIEYKHDSFKFIVDASSIKYVVDANNLDIVINYLNIKDKYDEYNSNYEYTNAVVKSIAGCTKAISEYYNKLLLLYVDKHLRGKEIFFPHFCDFRWRIYNASSIGITASKMFRYIYTYGKYANDELSIIRNALLKSKTHYIILQMLSPNIKKKIYDPLLLDSLFWSLIELGKINKTAILTDGFVDCESLLKEGYDIYIGKKKIIDDDLDSALLQISIKKIIDDIYKNIPLSTKHIFYKDSTASVLQLMTKLLGGKDNHMLEVMNINSSQNRGYDPYTYIVNKYIEYISHNIDNNKMLLKRKNLKKIIMTVQYSASTDSALKYYAESKNSTPNLLEENERNDVILFKKYLTDIIEQEHLFLKNSSSLTKEGNNKMYIYTKDNICFSLHYNKRKKKQIEVTIDNKRKSIVHYEITNIYDTHKTKQSLRANIIHIMDAYIARSIILEGKIGTIHDSFGIDIYKISLLIDSCNIIFNNNILSRKSSYIDKKNTDDTHSIFILL